MNFIIFRLVVYIMNSNNTEIIQAGEIVQSFISITRVLAQFSAQNAEAIGLSLQQMGILNIITAYTEVTLKEVADKLNLPKSAVSVNVDSLVNLGLINRKVYDEDRQEIHLSSTQNGKELSKKSYKNALAYKAMLLALEQLPEEDINLLVRIHKELLINLHNVEL